MDNSLETKLRSLPHPYLTDTELTILLEGSPDSRYGKVRRLLTQGKLLSIRRGLYSLTDKIGYSMKPDPFELAQYIYGPSYISLASALSFHQLIPEAVYTITSGATKRSKEFQTPLGSFAYYHLPLENFYSEVELKQGARGPFFIAKPWRAICDYVFCYRKEWKGFDPLIHDLRINLENLPVLSVEEIELLMDYYQHRRISRFLKGIQKENKI